MKMVQRPSSPTSLLWAHQLKREHGHLLTRIQAVEATNERNENRIKGAESAASSAQSNDVAALAKQVKALHEAGLGKRLAKIERDVREKLEDVQAGSEAMVLKIAALERDEAKVEEERKRGFGKEKAMLKRVGEIEEVVKKNGEELKQLGQADESEHIRDLKQAIEAVAKHVKRGGDEAKVVAKKVAALEAANDELKKTNERLVTQVASIAERPATVQARQMPNPFVKPVVKPASRPAPKQAVGSVLDDEPRSQDPRAPACLNCRKRHRRCDRARPTCKNCSEIGATCQWNSEPSQAAPSQQRAPKKPTASQVDGRRERKGVAAPVPRKRKADDEDADRPVIRAGKGWIEVAVTPSASDDEDGGSPDDSELVKEGPRRPRRGEIEQQTQAGLTAKKKTYDPLTSGSLQRAPEHETLPEPKAGTRRGREPNIFSSLISSPPPPPRRKPTSEDCGPLLAQMETQEDVPPAPAPPRRRQIIQVDESALLFQYGQ